MKKVAYIFDERLIAECNRLPTMFKRASIVQDLINAYEILSADNSVIVLAEIAKEDELKDFHSSSYVDFMKTVNSCNDLEKFDEEQLEYGLGYDCPLLKNNYDFISIVAGATLSAAYLLSKRCCNIAINWCGGWHHAQRHEAEGFCYVNDIVLGIQKLQKEMGKVLYVDLDVHHGNGVQNAFEYSKNVLTLSFHKRTVGFYPGTGSLEEVGTQNGLYYSLNVPFLDGISDETYLYLFDKIFPRVYEVFCPAVIVVQCGADILKDDPVGQCNVTLKAMGKCFKQILDCGKPCLILGGGGYNFPNTARYWAYLTAIAVDKTLCEDIPDHCQFFTRYAPSYELHIDPGNQKDWNSKVYIESVVSTVLNYCNYISEDK